MKQEKKMNKHSHIEITQHTFTSDSNLFSAFANYHLKKLHFINCKFNNIDFKKFDFENSIFEYCHFNNHTIDNVNSSNKIFNCRFSK